MGSYCRLVASMTVDELSGVVPVSVQDAGAASGGVAAMIAAISCGSEEGVVWGAKRYSVDCSGVRVKGFGGDDVNLVQYAAERGYVRGAVVGVLVGLGVGVRGVVDGRGLTP